jgi:hypothetical protein
MKVFEHAIVSLEGRLDPKSDDLACQYMDQNGDIVDGLDRFTRGGVDGKRGWELVSHDVVLVGDRTLTTFVFRRPAESPRSQESRV